MKKFNIILLIIFIILAMYLNFLPHSNYIYPLHVDEYVHWQYSNHLSSGSSLYFEGEYKSLEEGFHYLLATINSLGVDYLFMFRFFPILVTIFICLGIFVLTRKIWSETAGVFAVLFIALLQSSVMILGPVFLVPMALGLFFISIGLFLVNTNSKAWFLILACLLILHPPTALTFFLLINIYFLFIRKDYWKNIGLQVFAGLIALPLYLETFMSKGIDTINNLSFTQIVSALYIPRYLTLIVVIIVLIGIYVLASKKKYLEITFIISLLLFILAFYQLKIEVFIPYARALMYLFLIIAIPFGIAFDLDINKKIKIIFILIMLILVLIFSLPAKMSSNQYIYHIIDNKDYSAFIYIKDNTDKNSIAVLDPWKAEAFTPIAEREVYSRITQGPNSFYETRNNEIKLFFENNCSDLDFLRKNNITIVYGDCKNSELRNVYPGIYTNQ